MLTCISDCTDIPVIRQIAFQTWPSAYGHIISREQMDYMLDMMYSESSLTHQMKVLSHRFFLCLSDNKHPVGFASISPITTDGYGYKLHKLYVLPDHQHQGTGRKLLETILDELKRLHARTLELNVNRNNSALQFYRKLGFDIIREEDIDIGNGFFMNDYVMSKNVQ